MDNSDAVLRIGHLVFWGGWGDVGFFISPDGFEGWTDAPNTRSEDIERPAGHGSFDAEEFYESRILTVSGRCYATSDRELGQMRNELMGALHGRVQAHGNYLGERSYVWGRRFGAPRFEVTVPGRAARYQFALRCADPRRYGDPMPIATAAAGTDQQVFHWGNFPAAPVQIVAGSMPNGYRLDGPDGRSLTVGRAVTAGAPHRIDHATGVLSIGGVAQFGAITAGGFWGIDPGQIATHRLVPVSGTGTLDTILPPTYI